MNSRLDWLVLSDYYSIYVTNAPPVVNCTHPRENEKCVQFFFLHECFGVIVLFEKTKDSKSISLKLDKFTSGLQN